MASPNTLTGTDSLSTSVDAPGTGEIVTQVLFARFIQSLLNSITALSIHKQDAGGSFASQAYVDDRVRTARVTAKAHVNSPYAIVATDEIIELDSSTGTIQLNLPDPAQGQAFLIADVGLSAGTNNITLHRHGAEKILGVASDKALTATGGTWFIWSNGANWWISGSV